MKWLKVNDCNGRPCIIDLSKVSVMYQSYTNEQHTVVEMAGIFNPLMELDIELSQLEDILQINNGG